MSKHDKDVKDHFGWKDFLANGIQEFDGTSNVVSDFGKMTKRFGKFYLWYLSAAYEAKDEMSDEEFCAINGLVPIGFLKKLSSIS